MKQVRHGIVFLCMAVLLSAGCSDGGSSGGGDSQPIVNQNPAGVWAGYLIAEENTTFLVGIITEDREARLIGDVVQYEAGDDIAVSTTIFDGNFQKYTWKDALYGADSGTLLELTGYVAERALIWGVWTEDGDATDDALPFAFYYNTTYTVRPNVVNYQGDWRINDASVTGNTAILTITPDVVEGDVVSTTGGDITIVDEYDTYTGRITILYDTYNVYRVRMNIDGVDLEGLATYVGEMNTNGVEMNRGVLAIGANGSGASGVKSFSGLAVKVMP